MQCLNSTIQNFRRHRMATQKKKTKTKNPFIQGKSKFSNRKIKGC